MAVTISETLQKKLERVKKRKYWPVALLAKELGCSKKFIYLKINANHFEVESEIGFKKVKSDSVIKYFENGITQIQDASTKSDEFKKGFIAGLKIYKTAEVLGIDIDTLQLMIADYIEGTDNDGDIE